jgi:hypothetical protein
MFLAQLIIRPWRWKQYVPPKRRLTLNGLHGVISQKMVRFITTAVRTSNPTSLQGVTFLHIVACSVHTCWLLYSIPDRVVLLCGETIAERKSPLGRGRRRWQNHINIYSYVKELGVGCGLDLINPGLGVMAAVASTVMNFGFPEKRDLRDCLSDSSSLQTVFSPYRWLFRQPIFRNLPTR